MDISAIPLFALADRRLAWVDQRQTLLAANVANADTPGFRARDVTPFDDAMARATLAPTVTDPAHLTETGFSGAAVKTVGGERAPDGNAVALDQQMQMLADTDDAHALTAGLYRSWLGMFRTAIGH